MTIEFKLNETIQEVKNAFSAHFPYLSLEFYTQKHNAGEGSDAAQINHQQSLQGLIQHEGFLHITPDMKVSEFELMCANQFGLFVQVFRKSGKLWLQTIRTDHWTLVAQNEEGRAMCEDVNGDEIDDYHEQE